jgi:hypothetical protein
MKKRGSRPKGREVVWSPELAYAIGLMATDGSLSKDGRHLDFTSKDRSLIETLTACIGLQHLKIGIKQAGQPHRNKAYRVQWGDVRLYNFLLSIGLTPNKTKTIGSVVVPRRYYFDFLRGHFDGDGSFFSYHDPRWRSSFMFYLSFVSASPAHIKWLQSENEKLVGVKGHITSANERSVLQLKYAKRETLILLAHMYAHPGSACLKRKRLKITNALHIVGLTLPKG